MGILRLEDGGCGERHGRRKGHVMKMLLRLFHSS